MMHFATHTVNVSLLAEERSSNRNPGHLSRDKGDRRRVAKWSRKVRHRRNPVWVQIGRAGHPNWTSFVKSTVRISTATEVFAPVCLSSQEWSSEMTSIQ